MPLLEKRPGAPAGSFTVTIADGSFTFDDAANAQVNVGSSTAAASLAVHPWLRYVGGTGTYVPSEVEHYTYDSNGRVATLLSNGVLVNFAYNADGTIATLTYNDGTVDTFAYDGNGRLLSVSN